jgi:hypothetical protein
MPDLWLPPTGSDMGNPSVQRKVLEAMIEVGITGILEHTA